MLKTICGIFTASAIFLIAVNAMALDFARGRWWDNPGVVKALNLNENEQAQIETAFLEYRVHVGLLKDEVRIEQREIDNLMANPQKNERIIRERKSDMEKARSSLAKVKEPYAAKVRNILGPARFEKLVNLKR